MNEKELYKKQYEEKKLFSGNSFPSLRRVFKGFDLHREDLALSLLDSRVSYLGSERKYGKRQSKEPV